MVSWGAWGLWHMWLETFLKRGRPHVSCSKLYSQRIELGRERSIGSEVNGESQQGLRYVCRVQWGSEHLAQCCWGGEQKMFPWWNETWAECWRQIGISKVGKGNSPKFNIQPTLDLKMILFYLERVLHRVMRTEFGVKWNLNPGTITSLVTLSKFLKLFEPQYLQLWIGIINLTSLDGHPVQMRGTNSWLVQSTWEAIAMMFSQQTFNYYHHQMNVDASPTVFKCWMNFILSYAPSFERTEDIIPWTTDSERREDLPTLTLCWVPQEEDAKWACEYKYLTWEVIWGKGKETLRREVNPCRKHFSLV